MELPEGLTARPLVMSDARAVYEVMAAQELADIGQVEIEEADIIGDWSRPSFDVAAQGIGVFDGDRLVAYAEFAKPDRGDAAVDPAYRGRGIGTALARWMQEKAASYGATAVGMSNPEGAPGDGLLADLGHILAASEVGAQIRLGDIPVSHTVSTHFADKQVQQMVLAGGDDYELCFTAPARQHGEIAKLTSLLAMPLTCIGRITEQPGLLVRGFEDEILDIEDNGFDHFKRS